MPLRGRALWRRGRLHSDEACGHRCAAAGKWYQSAPSHDSDRSRYRRLNRNDGGRRHSGTFKAPSGSRTERQAEVDSGRPVDFPASRDWSTDTRPQGHCDPTLPEEICSNDSTRTSSPLSAQAARSLRLPSIGPISPCPLSRSTSLPLPSAYCLWSSPQLAGGPVEIARRTRDDWLVCGGCSIQSDL